MVTRPLDGVITIAIIMDDLFLGYSVRGIRDVDGTTGNSRG